MRSWKSNQVMTPTFPYIEFGKFASQCSLPHAPAEFNCFPVFFAYLVNLHKNVTLISRKKLKNVINMKFS